MNVPRLPTNVMTASPAATELEIELGEVKISERSSTVGHDAEARVSRDSGAVSCSPTDTSAPASASSSPNAVVTTPAVGRLSSGRLSSGRLSSECDDAAPSTRLERLARSANILLEDVKLERAADSEPHGTRLFRRTCLWSAAYIAFSVVLGLFLFSYFYADSNLVAAEIVFDSDIDGATSTASVIKGLFKANKIGLRCPCSKTNLPIVDIGSTPTVHNHFTPLCRAMQTLKMLPGLETANQLGVAATIESLCTLLSKITDIDLEQMKSTVIKTLVATDEAGLRDALQSKVEEQRTAYRRGFALAYSVMSTTKALDNQVLFQNIYG